MDDVPVEEIKRFEIEMIAALRDMNSEALKTVRETKALDDDTAAKLKEEITKFKSNLWKGSTAAPDSPAALAQEAREQGDDEAAEELAAEADTSKKGKKGKKAAAH
jgi:F-type H+-transporting ATPase subunit alpha